MHEILLVEDDSALGDGLKKFLSDEGYQVRWVTCIEDARKQLESRPSLIILDWMLPDGQGIDLLRDVRREDRNLPVIMLTARTEVIDKVLGLESGANDYIIKPFEPRELAARIRVQLRQDTRKEEKEESKKITLGELEIDLNQREVIYQGEKKEMTKMEFDFLCLLADSPNRAFSREEILNRVWGYENYPSTRTVDTHVLQIRQKLYEGLIETVRGVGYKLKFNS
jgi:DNA-binding response OmpR family regulator